MPDVAVGVLVPPTDGAAQLLDGQAVHLARPDDLGALAEALAPGTTHVVLLGERRHDVLVRRQAALLTDLGLAVSRRSYPHGPAAQVVMGLQAASCRLDAGLVPLFLDAYARDTWSAAWSPTVSKLEDPTPSMGQHLRSIIASGSGFLIRLSGDAGVTVVTDSPDVEGSSVERSSLLCAGEGVPEVALRHATRVSGATDSLVLPGLSLDPLERFGSVRAVELVALPADRFPVPAAGGLPRCAVCDAVVPTTFCPYCRVRPSSALLDPRGAL